MISDNASTYIAASTDIQHLTHSQSLQVNYKIKEKNGNLYLKEHLVRRIRGADD